MRAAPDATRRERYAGAKLLVMRPVERRQSAHSRMPVPTAHTPADLSTPAAEAFPASGFVPGLLGLLPYGVVESPSLLGRRGASG